MTAYADRVLACEMSRTRPGRPRGRPLSAPGMSFSRAPPRGAATAARPFATACRASTTPRRWASTSSISRPSTRSASPPARGATIRDHLRTRRTRRALCHRQRPAGGHKDVAPELGTLKDFDWLVKEITQAGMELALDFAHQLLARSSLRHEHPDWFYSRPDGTIKYAENPPKKYEDVYPLNFDTATTGGTLWSELRDVLLFWAGTGVRIFRVDNPHTKPRGLLGVPHHGGAAGVPRRHLPQRSLHPAEDDEGAGQGGLHPELHLLHLAHAQAGAHRVFRGADAEPGKGIHAREPLPEHARTSCPGICSAAPRNTFLHRFALAATLSPIYGIYSGFELCENEPFPGKEEYWDSEKLPLQGPRLAGAGQHHRLGHLPERHPPLRTRAAALRQPAFPPGRQRRRSSSIRRSRRPATAACSSRSTWIRNNYQGGPGRSPAGAPRPGRTRASYRVRDLITGRPLRLAGPLQLHRPAPGLPGARPAGGVR